MSDSLTSSTKNKNGSYPPKMYKNSISYRYSFSLYFVVVNLNLPFLADVFKRIRINI